MMHNQLFYQQKWPQISMQSKCPQVELTQVVSSAPLAPCCHTIDGVIRTCQAETCHFFFFPPVTGRKLIAHINFHSLKMTFNFAGRKLVGLASTRHCSRNNMSKWSDNAMRTLLFSQSGVTQSSNWSPSEISNVCEKTIRQPLFS